MIFTEAMDRDVTDMSNAEIDAARVAIGTFKLSLRQTFGWQKILDTLRPMNVRLDALNGEQEWRQRSRRR